MFGGIRVLDLTHVLAGPFAGYQIALHGADVIKIEHPIEVDQSRENGVDAALEARSMGTAFLTQGANRRTLTLDLKHAAGREVLFRLAATADALIENYRPGALAKLGCGWPALAAINPRLIYCSISAFGQHGPRAEQTAYDIVIQAISGLMALNGVPATGPLRVGAPVIDYATGMAAAYAMAAALFHRERTGRGQHIDVAMADVARLLMSSTITGFLHAGLTPTGSTGNRLPRATQGVYETAAGLLMIAANNRRQQRRLWALLGRPDLMSEGAAEAERNLERDRSVLATVFRTRSADAWEKMLQDGHVPAARVRDLGEAMQDQQVQARAQFAPAGMAGEMGREFLVPLGAFRSSESEASIRLPPRQPGADSTSILRDLGYSEADVRALRDAGVTGTPATRTPADPR